MLWRQRGLRVPVEPWYRTIRLWGLVGFGGTVFLSRQAEYSVMVVLFYFRDRLSEERGGRRCDARSPPVFYCVTCVYSRLSLAHRLRQGDPRAFGATNRGPSTRMTRQDPHKRGTRPREWSAAVTA
jgi:hypothetical protein